MQVLLDTGVLIRAFIPTDSRCAAIRRTLRRTLKRGDELVTSFQNIAEFCNVSSRPATARGGYGLDLSAIEARVEFIELFCHIMTETDDAYRLWKRLVSKHALSGVAMHDARIVAIMLSHRVNRIMTLDERDFRRYESDGISVMIPSISP